MAPEIETLPDSSEGSAGIGSGREIVEPAGSQQSERLQLLLQKCGCTGSDGDRAIPHTLCLLRDSLTPEG